MDWGCEWRHARKRWAEDFGWFLKKKAVSWDLKLEEWVEIRGWTKRVDFWTWARPVQLWTTGCPRVVGSDGIVSLVEIVFLSPPVEKPKSQEGNKSFVPELPRVVSVSSVFRIPMHTNVSCICIFYITTSGYVTSGWSSGRNLVIRLYLKNPREVCASHSPGWIPGCACTICSYDQM